MAKFNLLLESAHSIALGLLSLLTESLTPSPSPFVEESVDLSAPAELERVDRCAAAALDGALEVLLQLLDHPEHTPFKSPNMDV